MKKSLILLVLNLSISLEISAEIDSYPSNQSNPIFLSLILEESGDFELIIPEIAKSDAAPTNGYKSFINELLSELSGLKGFKRDSVYTTITFTVLDNGSLGYFNTFDETTKQDSIFIDIIKSSDTWKAPDFGPQRISLSISSRNLTVYSIVEKSAEYPGGINEFNRFISSEIRYPQLAIENGIEGRVFVQFIVEKDGSISNIEGIKGIGAGCDEEAMRVISTSPKWIPAENRGEFVRQKMIQGILFKLEKPKKKKKGN